MEFSSNKWKEKNKTFKIVWEKCELKKKYLDVLVFSSSSSAYILILKDFGFTTLLLFSALETDVAKKEGKKIHNLNFWNCAVYI